MSDPVEATEDAPEVAPEAPAAPVKKGAKAKKGPIPLIDTEAVDTDKSNYRY